MKLYFPGLRNRRPTVFVAGKQVRRGLSPPGPAGLGSTEWVTPGSVEWVWEAWSGERGLEGGRPSIPETGNKGAEVAKGRRMNVSRASIVQSLKCHFKELGIYHVEERASRDMICLLNLFYKEKPLLTVKRCQMRRPLGKQRRVWVGPPFIICSTQHCLKLGLSLLDHAEKGQAYKEILFCFISLLSSRVFVGKELELLCPVSHPQNGCHGRAFCLRWYWV